MAEQKSRFRKVMQWLSDARNLAWAGTAISAGLSIVSGFLLKASHFLANMEPGTRTGIIAGLAFVLFGVLLVPLVFAAHRIAVKSGLTGTPAGSPHPPAVTPLPAPPVMPSPGAAQLSTQERELVQDHRTVWLRFGRQAVGLLNDLFSETVGELRRKHYLGRALDGEVQRLKESTAAMDRAVADDSTATIAEVRERLTALYLTYLGAARWLTEVQDKESDVFIGPRLERLKYWQRAHRKWHDRMKDLDTVPAHRQTLRIYLTPWPEPHQDRLIREAESD